MLAVDASAPETILQECQRRGVGFIRFEMPDLMGLPRSKTIPVDSLADFVTSGVNMYGGTLGLDSGSFVTPGSGIAEEAGYRDAYLVPDLSTFRIHGWEPDTASVICKPLWGDDRKPMPQSPRNVLDRLIVTAAEMGFSIKSGHELEFYLYDAATRKPLFAGNHIFLSTRNHYTDFIKNLLLHLKAMGFRITTHNAEYAPSQFEINFAPSSGLKGADDAFRFKAVVKEFAQRSGYLASFMSKPAAGIAGSGYHLHIGLNRLSDGSNAFNGSEGPSGLSDVAMRFMAGVLRHAPAMTALMAPTINCYHRFLHGSFAPSRISWGFEDRTALVRMKATSNSATHMEMRGGGGAANPYLIQAAVLAAGLIGLQQNYDHPPVPETLAEDNPDSTRLPGTLAEALVALESDSAMVAALGAPFVSLFKQVKRHEIQRWRAHISDWETAEYLELY